MRCIKLTLAYDGTAYAGWQFQPGQRTLQGVLEDALHRITGETIRTLGSGRTDAGVHALGQVVSFRSDSPLSAEVLQRALNAELPSDVAVRDVSEVAENFQARHDAVSKRYRYVIYDGPVRDVFRLRFCWHCRRRLDVAVMDRAARALLGTHDFRSLQASGSQRGSTIRTIRDIQVQRSDRGRGDVVVIEVEADGFLYHMVRTIVGTLVQIGQRRRPESWMAEVLEARDRRAAGPTAPPQGLFLVRAEYEASSTGQGRGVAPTSTGADNEL
jgi:tRNA pseudouridine38-40 synthase